MNASADTSNVFVVVINAQAVVEYIKQFVMNISAIVTTERPTITFTADLQSTAPGKFVRVESWQALARLHR
jgi:hypothetical protein